MGTKFAQVYNRFLGKITDDMYMELTPEDTMKDLQNLLIHSIPGFEFPRQVLTNYFVDVVEVAPGLIGPEDFVIGMTDEGFYLVEHSYFYCLLTAEEINILAILMMEAWL